MVRGFWRSHRFALGVLLGGALALPAAPAGAAPPANDDFAAAETFVTAGGSSEGYTTENTAEATLETGEPQPASCVADGGSVGRTVWLKLVVGAGDGWRRLELSDGSSIGMPGHELDDAVWAVWTGSSLSTLTQVACNDNFGLERWPNLIFPVVGGQTYYLQIGGARGASAPEADAWGGEQRLFVGTAAGPPALTLHGPGNATGAPVEYVQPGVAQHWDISTSGQTTTASTGGTSITCTVDGVARSCSAAAGLDFTPTAGEHTIVARLVNDDGDVWATTTKRFTAGVPPATTGVSTAITRPLTTEAGALVAPALTLGKLRLATIARKRAIAVRCAVSERGRCRVTVTISGKTAKRIGLTRSARRPYRLATGSIAFSAAGTKTLRLRIARAVAKRIRRARSLALRFTTTGEYPTGARSARRTVTVRR